MIAKTPDCNCFNEGRGQQAADQIAGMMCATFSELMAISGTCPKGYDYVLEKTLVMLIRSIAAQTAKDDAAVEDRVFREMLLGMEDRLRARNVEMERDALAHDKAAAGGVQ
jgi:hypothetical protein